jgi:hypothetical protein
VPSKTPESNGVEVEDDDDDDDDDVDGIKSRR